MRAPVYSPAETYRAPRRLPRVFSTRDTPVSVLQANPAAWAIVSAAIPGIDRRIGNDMLKPHLTNFSLQSMVSFGVIPRDVLPAIDEKLKALGVFP